MRFFGPVIRIRVVVRWLVRRGRVRECEQAIVETFLFNLLRCFFDRPCGLRIAFHLIIGDMNRDVAAQLLSGKNAMLAIILKGIVPVGVAVDANHVVRVIIGIQRIVQIGIIGADLFQAVAIGKQRLNLGKPLGLFQIEIFVRTVILPKLFFTAAPVPKMRGRHSPGSGHIDILRGDRGRIVGNRVSESVIIHGVLLCIIAAFKNMIRRSQVVNAGKLRLAGNDMVKVLPHIGVVVLWVNKMRFPVNLFRNKGVAAVAVVPCDRHLCAGSIAIRGHGFFDRFPSGARGVVDNRVLPHVIRVVAQVTVGRGNRVRADVIPASPHFIGRNTALAVLVPGVYVFVESWIY